MGSDCSACQSGYYHSDANTCSKCPGKTTSSSLHCGGNGQCDDSTNGLCVCSSGYGGPSCTSPFITGVSGTPTTEGSGSVVVTGTNFGSSTGTITFGGVTCVTSSWGNTRIVCSPVSSPGVDRPAVVVRSSSGELQANSGTVYGAYAAPTISNITPREIITGGQDVTIAGTSFGEAAQVFFSLNGASYTELSRSSHSKAKEVIATAAAGVGLTTYFKVKLFNQWSNVVTNMVTYANPYITQLSRVDIDTSGGSLHITGGNFGTSSLVNGFFVDIGGVPCSPTSVTHGSVTCLVPYGVDTRPQNVRVGFATTNQIATADDTFSYNGPVIHSLEGEGCHENTADGTIYGCKAVGGSLIITGVNFGNVGDELISGIPLLVFVNGVSCLFPTVLAPEEGRDQLRCVMQGGAGFDLTIRIERGVKYHEKFNAVSFAGPEIDPNTLRLFGGSNPGPGIPVTNPAGTTDGGDSLQFYGTFSDITAPVEVVYGGPRGGSTSCEADAEKGVYACDVTDFDDGQITCTTTPGVGAGLTFQVCFPVSGGTTVSNIGLDSFSYPTPKITNGTLRLTEAGPGYDIVDSLTTQGETVYFEGQHFGSNNTKDSLNVLYGPSERPYQYVCSVDYEQSSDSLIRCSTKPGSGTNLTFTVITGHSDTARQSVRGYDQYSYPEKPTITSISTEASVCTAQGSRLIDCPTDAIDPATGLGIVVTIAGTNFGVKDAVVRIGSLPCLYVVVAEGSASLTCQLPSNTGLRQAVVVEGNKKASDPAYILSYALPSVDSIEGCAADDTVNGRAVDCARRGNDQLTIRGDNFGESGATILVGGETCTNPTHDETEPHSILYCMTPEGWNRDLSLMVIQDNGDQATFLSKTVSYLQCSPGHYSDKETDCHECEVGFYASQWGQGECQPCPVGSYSDTAAATGCIECGSGTFSNSTNSTECFPCEAGYYQNDEGQSKCIPCAAGKSALGTGNQECLACDRGFHQPVGGEAECIECPAGKSVNITGQAVCEDCAKGRFTNGPSRTECDLCPAGFVSEKSQGSEKCTGCPVGKYADNKGSLSCSLCPPGTFAGAENSTSCEPCAAGFANEKEGQFECEPCSEGTYTSYRGALKCDICAKGTYAASNESTLCKPCEVGKFQFKQGQSFCEPCQPGEANDKVGQASCVRCDPGYYANETEQVTCDVCVAGTYSEREGQGSTTCIPCKAGQYSPTSGLSRCIQCRKGTVSEDIGSSVCTSCEPGEYQPGEGQTECKTCPKGRFNPSFESLSCDACPLGTFQDEEGKSSCKQCQAGQYNDEEGSDRCESCLAGFQAPFNASIRCDICKSGRFAAEAGTPSCEPCDVGTYSLIEGSRGAVNCTLCPEGTFAAYREQTLCRECPVGKQNALVGQSNCTSCDVGRYQPDTGQLQCLSCAAGDYQPDIGKTGCLQCPAGKFSEADSDRCTVCPEGTYTDQIGQSQCKDCEAGRFGAATSAQSCQLCPVGKFMNVTGQTDCHACEAGTANDAQGAEFCPVCTNGTVSSRSATKCSGCGSKSIAPYEAMTQCVSCAGGALANSQRTKCVCPEGEFLPDVTDLLGDDSGNVTIGCLKCPKGADCTREGTSFADMRALPGWWRTSDASMAFHRCLLPKHCKGGRYDDDPEPFLDELSTGGDAKKVNQTSLNSELCDGHRTGPLCAYCEVGYSSATAYSDCSKCPDKGSSIAATVGISALVLLVLLGMYYIVLRSDQSILSETEWKHRQEVEWDTYDSLFRAKSFKKTKSNLRFSKGRMSSSSSDLKVGSINEDDEKSRVSVAGSDIGVMDEHERERLEHIQMHENDRTGLTGVVGKVRSSPSITYKLKILVGFFQIAVNLAFAVDVPWPSHYRRFIQIFSFFSLDFIPWQSMECVTSLDYYTKLLIVTLTPIAILGLIVIFFLLPMYVINKRDMNDDEARRLSNDRRRRQFWKLTLFTIFLIWPNVCATILGLFVCKDVNGTSYVLTDMEVECYDSRWWNFLPPALVMIIVYPVGVPLLFFYFLYSSREKFSLSETKLQLGFLYEAYTTQAWFFELLDMVHKLTLTSLIAFVPFEQQMQTAMSVLAVFTAVILVLKPYHRKGDDRLHLLANTELFLFVLAGLILIEDEQANGTLDDRTDVAASAILIAITCGFILAFFAIGGWSMRKMIANIRRRINGDEEEAPAAGEELHLKFVKESESGRLFIESDGAKVGVVSADDADLEIKTRTGTPQRSGSAAKFHINPLLLDRLAEEPIPEEDVVGEGETVDEDPSSHEEGVDNNYSNSPFDDDDGTDDLPPPAFDGVALHGEPDEFEAEQREREDSIELPPPPFAADAIQQEPQQEPQQEEEEEIEVNPLFRDASSDNDGLNSM